MPSSNADQFIVDEKEFTTLHGLTPTEYVSRVAVGYLLAPKLAQEQKALDAAKVKRDATTGWETLSGEAMAAGADAENAYLAQVQVVNALTARKKAAIAFGADGNFAAFRGLLGNMSQALIDNGSVDEGAVLDAVRAAQA